jgi:hypothetical protein
MHRNLNPRHLPARIFLLIETDSMSEFTYPVDKITGLPYPVVPYETSNEVDTNHVAFHSDNPLLQGLAGLAVRYARVQEMDRGEHEILHERYIGMQKLPEDIDEQFEYCIWASLGDIPQHAVDLNRRSHWVKTLDNDQTTALRNRDIRVDSNQILAHFFAHYIQEQSLHYIDEFSMDRYLFTPFKSQKAHKGQWLLREAVETAVAPLQSKYRRLRRDGRIAVKSHVKLSDVVMSKISKQKREDFVKRKRHELSLAGDISRPSRILPYMFFIRPRCRARTWPRLNKLSI